MQMKAFDIMLLDQTRLTRQHFAKGERILSAGQPTDRAVIIESGSSKQSSPWFDGKKYSSGDIINFIEFLALEHYQSNTTASEPVVALILSRADIKEMLDRNHNLTWPLSCMLAIDATKRHPSQVSS